MPKVALSNIKCSVLWGKFLQRIFPHADMTVMMAGAFNSGGPSLLTGPHTSLTVRSEHPHVDIPAGGRFACFVFFLFMALCNYLRL